VSAADVIGAVLIANAVEPELAVRLAHYGEAVLDANRTTNLTATREPERFAEHILDALTLVGDIDGPLIDIGSGAGLPGLPLAIATGVPIVVVDSAKKKAAFLARALRDLGITGEALDRRAESLGSDPAFRERFRCATARAVASAPTVAELTVPFVALGGRALLQRGSMDERERGECWFSAKSLLRSCVSPGARVSRRSGRSASRNGVGIGGLR
jgi:16S rRNA (guanine(527)-N(7))-methyltransferase RsmG